MASGNAVQADSPWTENTAQFVRTNAAPKQTKKTANVLRSFLIYIALALSV